MESAGARCVNCSRPGSVVMETLTAKESVVLELDQGIVEQLPLERRKWVEQVHDFLQRCVMLYILCML